MANPLARAARQRARVPVQQNGHASGAASGATALKDVRYGELLGPNEAGQPRWHDWSTEKAIKEGYKANAWVYVAVTRIAKTAASVPWKTYDIKGDEAEEAKNHPLTELLKKPNPYISGGDTIERLVMHLYLGGNGLLTKVRPSQSGPIAELWPLPPDAIKVVPSRTEFIERYVYERGGVKRDIAAEDIFHAMFVDPADIYWGISPLMALARTVDTDIEAVRWNKVTLQNMARSDGILTLKPPPGATVTREQWEDARTAVREGYQGADNAHNIWVVGNDASFVPITMTPAELDFIQSRKLTREEILGVYGVPPPVAGIYEDATLANLEASRVLFWKETVLPLLDDLASALNLSITPEFGDGIELRYDTSDVDALRENYGDKVEQASKLFGMGVPLNVINSRLEMGFDEIEGGDTGYVSASLTPATGDIPEEPEPEPSEAPPQLQQPVSGTPDDPNAITVVADDSLPAPEDNAPKAKLVKDQSRASLWKALDNRRLGYEAALTRRSKSRYIEEGKAVADAFSDGGEVAAYARIIEYRAGWEMLVRASHTVVVEDFGSRALEQVRKDAHTARASLETKEFDPSGPEVTRWIREHAAESATLIAQTNRKEVGRVIAEGYADGLTADAIARDLRKHYRDNAPYKATRLARTEVVRASNYGSHEGVAQSGLSYTRTWISSGDDRVRDSHADADGQTVGQREPYDINGYPAMYPGDPMLPGDETVMCRCVETFNTL